MLPQTPDFNSGLPAGYIYVCNQDQSYDFGTAVVNLAYGNNGKFAFQSAMTGSITFNTARFGDPLPGLNLCGAGRVVCLIDPIGDVYACPFAIHDRFKAGNILDDGGFATVWRESELFTELRGPQSGGVCTSCSAFDACRGGCMAAKFFTGLPLDGPDPECVKGHSELALLDPARTAPAASQDHSRASARKPVSACDENPLSDLTFIPLEALTTSR